MQRKETRRFIELSAMNFLLLLVITLLFLSGPFVNAGPVGDFFKKVGQSISKPFQPEPQPQSPPLNLRRRRTPRGDPLRGKHLRPRRRDPQSHHHRNPPKEEEFTGTVRGVSAADMAKIK